MPTLEREGGSLYYELLDCTPPWVENPPAIVFCHGVGTNADIWSDWLPVLAGRFRIARYDMRGFGRSSVPGPGFDWSLDLLAQDALAVAALAEAELAEGNGSGSGGGDSAFHYVGESLGGTVGLVLGASHPQRLLSLTACSTAHKGGDIQKVHAWRAFIEKEGMEAWSRQMMDERFNDGAVPPAVYDWFHRIQKDSSPHTTLDVADLLMRTDLTENLAAITAPTLLLSPDSSPFVSLAITQNIQAGIAECEVQVFAGARHGLACSHGKECATALLGFLERRKLA
jgi:pimeloyl-ACP methyl ester carboxylesterase